MAGFLSGRGEYVGLFDNTPPGFFIIAAPPGIIQKPPTVCCQWLLLCFIGIGRYLTHPHYHIITILCPLCAVITIYCLNPLDQLIKIMSPHGVVHILFAWHPFCFKLSKCQAIADTQSEPIVHTLCHLTYDVINHLDFALLS